MKFRATTASTLELPAGRSEMIVFDDACPGLGLRIREGGSRNWIYQYKLASKQRRLTLGSAKAIDLTKARNGYEEGGRKIPGAIQLHAMVRLGQDPAAQKVEGRVKAADTLDTLIRRYLEHQQQELRPRSFLEVRRHLEGHAKPLHGLPVSSIDRRTIADRLDAIAKKSGVVASNRVRASLSGMFTWGTKRGLVSGNPVAATDKREERSRERVLSYDELRLIWNALGDDDYGAIVRLLTLTGQRLNEIAGLRWSELLDDMIDLPGERTKNGRPHFVPLAAPARAILEARPRRITASGKPRDLIFGSGEGPFSGWSGAKEQLDARILAAMRTAAEKAGKSPEDVKPPPHWTLHDLRRTMATKMADDLKALPHVIEATINHISGHKGGIAGIYNRAVYLPERRQALTLWGEHVLAVVEGRKSNVTVLKRA
jgi:integrase